MGQSSVLKAAGGMGVATLMSRVLGLVREQIFAYLFGAGNATDAYLVAFRIPNLLRNLFAEGAMSASLVPTFMRARLEEGDRRAWRVAGLVFRVLFVSVSALAALGVIFAPGIVSLYAGAFHQIPGKFELTVRMTRWMFPFFPLVALSAAFMGILNACGYFFLPALSSAIFNIVSVVVGVGVSLFLFSHGAQWGIEPIEGMALGVLAGGIAQAFAQLPVLYRVGYRWQPRRSDEPSWREDPALRRMIGMMAPGTVGLAATQLSIAVNTWLATTRGPGAVSWLGYAFRLMQFPIGLFGASLATAVLPRLAQQWVEKDALGAKWTIERSLRQIFAINLPASAGLAFLGIPIIELIFQYGRFTPADTQNTALALTMYAIGLTAYSMVKVLVPACYALGNTRIPVIASIVTVITTLLLNLLMVGPFGFWGLALGTSIGAILNGTLLLVAVRRILGREGVVLEFLPISLSFVQNLIVAFIMGSLCLLTHQALNQVLPDQVVLQWSRSLVPFVRALKVGWVVIEGLVIVALVGRLAGIKEVLEITGLLSRKFKNKLRPGRT